MEQKGKDENSLLAFFFSTRREHLEFLNNKVDLADNVYLIIFLQWYEKKCLVSIRLLLVKCSHEKLEMKRISFLKTYVFFVKLKY